MPCGSIAVVRAAIEVKYTEELLRSEPGLRALAKALVPILGIEPSLRLSPGRAVLQGENGLQIILDAGGLRVEARYMRYTAQQEVTRQVAKVAEALAIPLAQERIVQGLKDRYGHHGVLTDQQVGANRVVKLRIPL